MTLLQAKEHQGLPAATRTQGRGLGQIPASEPPEGTTPDNALPLDFRPPELQGNTFLVSKPPSLGYSGTAALGKSHVEGGRQRWGQSPDPHNFQELSTNFRGSGVWGYWALQCPKHPGFQAQQLPHPCPKLSPVHMYLI